MRQQKYFRENDSQYNLHKEQQLNEVSHKFQFIGPLQRKLSQHLVVQSQQEKQQDNMCNLFKVNFKYTRTTSIFL